MIDRAGVQRLGVAAALSGAAHAAIIMLGGIEVPAVTPVTLPLAVRMETTPASVAPDAKPRPSRARAHSPAPPLYASPAAVSDAGPAEAAEAAEITSSMADPPPAAADEALAPAPPAPAAAPTPAPVPEEPVTEAVHRLPRKGHITYELVYGRDRFPVGRTVQTWEVDGEGYRLASRSETVGIVDLVRSQHRTYSSSGTMTRAGLRPDTFMMSRNRGRRTEEARARFDWDGATVMLGPAAGQRQESLPARSQDLLSFMYQLSLSPPPIGRMRQVVTNGTRIETYELDVLPEEIIETPLGSLRAIPIRQVRRPNAESLTLWLGVEYRYLPVRLRFFDRDGHPQGEQIVTDIRLTDP